MIRRAEQKDIPDVLRLLVQVDMVHHQGRPDLFKGPATKYGAEQLERIFSDEKTPVFVFQDEEGRVLGYAFCILREVKGDRVLEDIRTLYIDDLCVDENCRGRHIGTALYRHAAAFAREQGCHNVTLNVWALNENAMRFYRSLGMKEQKIGMEEILE